MMAPPRAVLLGVTGAITSSDKTKPYATPIVLFPKSMTK
jgi:hypothetical protein